MIKHTKATACAFTLLMTTVLPSFAQGERWYRVELLIFAAQNNLAARSEQWEPEPALSYPNAARFLIDPAYHDANLAQHGGNSMVDEYGRQFLSPATAQVTPSSSGSGQLEVSGAPLRPTPFAVLPRQARELEGKAAYMEKSGRYRTLFHQAWVQPVVARSQSIPIVLDRSGDGGQWPALQGSIVLHLSRYLHLETNLWLNTSGDYMPANWQMPAPPLGPPSLIVEALEPQYISNPAIDPAPAPKVDEATGADGEMEEAGPEYPYRHAVTLTQKRRMRSKEVHYIDHPMFGLVIQLLPLTEAELEAMARATSQSGASSSATSSGPVAEAVAIQEPG